jgi:chemotaxis protein CheX
MELMEFNKEEIRGMVNKSVVDVFKTMLSMDLKLSPQATDSGEDTYDSPLSRSEGALIVGNVGFVGVVSGMVYIAMTESFARKVAMEMLGMSDSEIGAGHDLVNDVIGELTNMSSGGFKNQLCDKGFSCRLSIPSIIRGKYFVVEGTGAQFRQIYIFSNGDDLLTFELFMKMEEDSDDDGKL